MKIGIFDSGYGGLTILEKIRARLPQYDSTLATTHALRMALVLLRLSINTLSNVLNAYSTKVVNWLFLLATLPLPRHYALFSKMICLILPPIAEY